MPHDKISRLAGNETVLSMKGNPIDHCCHKTAGMDHKVEEKVEHMYRHQKVMH
jgi:hypothetical protein